MGVDGGGGISSNAEGFRTMDRFVLRRIAATSRALEPELSLRVAIKGDEDGTEADGGLDADDALDRDSTTLSAFCSAPALGALSTSPNNRTFQVLYPLDPAANAKPRAAYSFLLIDTAGFSKLIEGDLPSSNWISVSAKMVKYPVSRAR